MHADVVRMRRAVVAVAERNTPMQTKPAAFRFEMANGEQFHLGLYVSRLLRTQDLNAWRNDPEGFDAWIKKSVDTARLGTGEIIPR